MTSLKYFTVFWMEKQENGWNDFPTLSSQIVSFKANRDKSQEDMIADWSKYCRGTGLAKVK